MPEIVLYCAVAVLVLAKFMVGNRYNSFSLAAFHSAILDTQLSIASNCQFYVGFISESSDSKSKAAFAVDGNGSSHF